MRRAWAALLLALPSAAAAAPKRSIRYALTIDPSRPEAALRVEARFHGPCEARRAFKVTTSYGAAKNLDLLRDLSFVDGEGRTVPATREGDAWTLPGEACAARASYAVDASSGASGLKPEDPGDLVMPKASADLVSFGPSFVLLRSSPSPAAVELSWILPDGWSVASGSRLEGKAPLGDLLGGFVIAYRKDAFLERRESSLRVLAPKNAAPPAELNALFEQARLAARSDLDAFPFLKERPEYLVLMQRSSQLGGEARRGAFLLEFPAGAATNPGFVDRFAEMTAHEFFHALAADRTSPRDRASVETGGDLRWLGEGFTNYFARVALRASGRMSPTGFVNEMAEYESLALRRKGSGRFGLVEASRGFFTDKAKHAYSYEAGAALAFKLDWLMRRSSNGRRTLTGFLKKLASDPPKDYREVIALLEDYDAAAAAAALPHLEGEENVALAPILEELGARKSVKKIYRMGAEAKDRPDALCLVTIPARLEAAGIRAGDCIVEVAGEPYRKRDQIFAHELRPISAVVEREGKRVPVSFTLAEAEQVRWEAPKDCPNTLRGLLCR